MCGFQLGNNGVLHSLLLGQLQPDTAKPSLLLCLHTLDSCYVTRLAVCRSKRGVSDVSSARSSSDVLNHKSSEIRKSSRATELHGVYLSLSMLLGE